MHVALRWLLAGLLLVCATQTARPQTPEAPPPVELFGPADSAREGRLFGGYAATFFKPRFGGAAAGTLGTTPAVSPVFPALLIPATIPLAPNGGGVAEYGRESDGRWWLGYQTPSGWGARARYSHYHSSSDPIDAVASGSAVGQFDLIPIFSATQTLTATENSRLLTSLGMDVLDLDATYEVSAGNWSLLAGGGARYAKLQRRTQLARTLAQEERGTADVIIIGNVLDVTALTNQSVSQQMDQEFRDWGPTVVLEGRRNLAVGRVRGAGFINLRASRLIGTTTLDARTSTADQSQVFGQILGTPISTSNSSTSAATSAFERPAATTIYEVEVGLETGWQTRLGEFFVRGSWEGQQWRHGGNVIGASAEKAHLYLSGWTIGGGWRY
jgi:hypothetical protein